MSKVFSLSVSLLLFSASTIAAETELETKAFPSWPGNWKSQGYKMGTVLSCESEGGMLTFSRSVECKIHLGSNENWDRHYQDQERTFSLVHGLDAPNFDPANEWEENLAVEWQNPNPGPQARPQSPGVWTVSAHYSEANHLRGLTGQQVWVQYFEARNGKKKMGRETSKNSIKIQTVDPGLCRDPLYRVKHNTSFFNESKSGTIEGRIVSVTKDKDGYFFGRHYEMVIQIGEGWNLYKRMSIFEDKMYEYARDCLKSGKLVKVFYDKQRKKKSDISRTSYDVFKIEPVR